MFSDVYASNIRLGYQISSTGLLMLMLGGFPLRGQQRSDLLAWGSVGVRIQPDSSRWALDATYQYLTHQNLSRTYLHLGTAHVTYFLPKHSLALSAGYITGRLSGQAGVQVIQVRLFQTLSDRTLRPRWQLTLDQLRLSARDSDPNEPVYRIRYLAGIEPPLTKQLDLVLNTEPFLYRTPTWFREVRSQAGLRWRTNPH